MGAVDSRTAVSTASVIAAVLAGDGVFSGAVAAVVSIAIKNIGKKIIKIINVKNGENNSKINFIGVHGLVFIFSIFIRAIIKIKNKNNYLINFNGVVAIII